MSTTLLVGNAIERFSEEARRAVYDAIALRRDVRHFREGLDVDAETLERILGAAHLAPSVGFSQPWGFVVVRDLAVRQRIRASFLQCRAAEAARFAPERREKYLSYRLEGVVEAALNVCVAVDLRSKGEAILGTTAQPEAVRASACCAVQNLWLAARAEGVGVGWVSIVEPAVLRAELALPRGVEPIAYLCIGYPQAFRAKPMLEEVGWSPRKALREVIHPESRWREEVAEPPARAPLHARTSVAPADEGARASARAHQATLTKPAGSLGRLEDIAAWYCASRGIFPAAPPARAALALFAADHGVTVEGVSAFGSQVTAGMLCNVMAGGAAVNVLARRLGVELVAIDVGVAGDLGAAPRDPEVALVRAALRAGTANLRRGPAMTREEAEAALAVGGRVADDLAARGAEIVGAGEIGIGNTTSAAALVCVFTRSPPRDVVGRGTGIDDAALLRKIGVVEDALALHAPDAGDPVGVLAAVGGLELAAMAGFFLRAASHRLPIVLDGFLAGAAALVAQAMSPNVTAYMLASHASAEQGARALLEHLGLAPVLSLGMRLGEGTGALLAIDLVRSAVALQHEMATFATAGVVDRERAP